MTLPVNDSDRNKQKWIDVAPGETAVRVSSVPAPSGTAQPTSVAVQSVTLLNQRQTSGANAAQAITLAGVAGARNVLRKLVVDSSAAGAATVTVSDGGTVVLDLGTVTTGVEAKVFDLAPLTASVGNALVVNVGAAGVGVTTTVSVVADRT